MDYTQYVSPPGRATTSILCTAPNAKHESTRSDGIAKDVEYYDENRTYLKKQAIAKDKLFKQNVEEVRSRIAKLTRKLEKDVVLRDAAHESTKKRFVEMKEKVREDVLEKLARESKKVEDEWIPPEEKRCEDWLDDFHHFVNVTVPSTIESQSGRVTRHLIKSQETFEIDNTKLIKREKKIWERFEEHKALVGKGIKQQESKRRNCFVLLEEDINADIRQADRREERFQTGVNGRIKEVIDMESGLSGIRKKTDADILAATKIAMERTQKIIIDNWSFTPEP